MHQNASAPCPIGLLCGPASTGLEGRCWQCIKRDIKSARARRGEKRVLRGGSGLPSPDSPAGRARGRSAVLRARAEAEELMAGREIKLRRHEKGRP